MANDISTFFDAESDKSIAVIGVKDHITHTWEPRMLRALLDYAQKDGSELNALARDAVSRIQAEAK